jgi:hypothetical protein
MLQGAGDLEQIVRAPKMRYVIGYLIAAAMLLPLGRHEPDPADDSLRLYAVDIVQNPAQSWTGRGVYLGKGLVITAAHVVGSAQRTQPNVRVANLQLPATAIKEGNFEQVDLTLLAVDQQKLPISLQLRRMPLCQIPPWAGEPVIVAVPDSVASSTIMSPQSLPANLRTKFPTVISFAVKIITGAGNNLQCAAEPAISIGHNLELCSLLFAYDVSTQQAFEICDGLRQPIAQLHLRLPSQQLLRPADVGAALLGIISRQRAMNDLG